MVIATAGCIFDRVCVSGEFNPAINFALCRWYQKYQFGCIVLTKEDLNAIYRYLSLGLKYPFPFIETNEIKELNRADLDMQINTKVDQVKIKKQKIKNAVDVAVKRFKTDFNIVADSSKMGPQKSNLSLITNDNNSKSKGS